MTCEGLDGVIDGVGADDGGKADEITDESRRELTQ
jgi:hypothetical protein